MNFAGNRCYISNFHPYASKNSNSPSPLMKCLRSADTVAAAASPTALFTPGKVEEDVIVVNEIPVPTSKKGSGEVRSLLMPSNFPSGSFGRSNSTSSPSSKNGGRGSLTENSALYKKRLRRFPETRGICQLGSDCQFAHGKEELRPYCSSTRIKPEIFKLTNSLEGSTSSSYGSKPPHISRVKAKEAVFSLEGSTSSSYGSKPPHISRVKAKEAVFSLPSVPTKMGFPTSPFEQPSESPISSGPISSGPISSATLRSTKSDWTPKNDGIEINLSWKKNSSREDVDAYIEKVLYQTNTRKRLPVFVEICPLDC